jgi:hypothetical protein
MVLVSLCGVNDLFNIKPDYSDGVWIRDMMQLMLSDNTSYNSRHGRLLELDHSQIWGNLLSILLDNDLDSQGHSEHQEKDTHYGMPIVSPVRSWFHHLG